jgi:uncharacterized protein YlxW (UPF0749 family)
MKFNISFGKHRSSNNQQDAERKRHDDILRNLQNQVNQTKMQIDSLSRELNDLLRRNMLDFSRKQQMERQIDDLKGMIMRLMSDMQRERDEFRKRTQHHKKW